MKKIIALILALSCIFALASCEKEVEENNEKTDYTAEIAAVQSAIDASAPGIAEISVLHESDLGELNGKYDVVYNKDGSATVTYMYQTFNEFDPKNPAEDIIETHTGVANVDMDGTVYDEQGNSEAIEGVFFEIKLDASKLEDVTVVAGVLRAKIKAANTAAVLGTAVGHDVEIAVATGANRVTSISIAYDTKDGHVKISTIYSYPIPEEDVEEGTDSE